MSNKNNGKKNMAAVVVESKKLENLKYEIHKCGGSPEFYIKIILEFGEMFKMMWIIYADKSGKFYQHVRDNDYVKILYEVDDSIEIADDSKDGNAALVLGKPLVAEIQKKIRDFGRS